MSDMFLFLRWHAPRRLEGSPVLWYWSPAVGEIQCSELEKYYCCYFQYITSRHQHLVNGGRGSQYSHANIVNYLLMSTEELGGIYGVTLTLLIAGAKWNRSGKSEANTLQMSLTELLCIKYVLSTYCRGAPWLEVRHWLSWWVCEGARAAPSTVSVWRPPTTPSDTHQNIATAFLSTL